MHGRDQGYQVGSSPPIVHPAVAAVSFYRIQLARFGTGALFRFAKPQLIPMLVGWLVGWIGEAPTWYKGYANMGPAAVFVFAFVVIKWGIKNYAASRFFEVKKVLE